MLPLYLFCLAVGGGLLLFSLVGGHHADGVQDGGIAHDHGLPTHDGDGYAHDFFSIRALTYFLAGFGAAGALLELLTDAPPVVGGLWAAASGMASAAAAAVIFGWLRRTESGLVPVGSDHLVGLAAEVVVPVEPAHRGKVRVVAGGREVELLARLFSPDDPPCPRGSRVVVVDMDGPVALVTPLPAFPPDLS